MAYIKTRSKYLQKVRIELGRLFGEENDSDVFVVLREPTSEMMLEMSGLDDTNEKAIIDYFRSIFPSILIDHNFYEDEGMAQKMGNDAVTEVIFDVITIATEVTSKFFSAAFFTRQQRTEE